MSEELSPHSWPWWTIRGDELMRLLRAVQGGEDPELVYLEAYANTRRAER